MKPFAPGLTGALRQAEESLASDPADAARRAKAILSAAPRHPAATLILASARRRQHAPAEALSLLRPLARTAPANAIVQYELGETLAVLGRTGDAVSALRRAVAARADMAVAWRALADLLFQSGDRPAADEAYRRYVAAPIGEPLIAEANAAIERGQSQAAERACATTSPCGRRTSRPCRCWPSRSSSGGLREAAVLLEIVLERYPGYVAARHARALAHLRLNQPTPEVAADLRQVLSAEPDNTDARHLLGAALMALGDALGAADAFERALETRPDDPVLLTWYGEQLKYAGRLDESIAAFRRATARGARPRRRLVSPRRRQDLSVHRRGGGRHARAVGRGRHRARPASLPPLCAGPGWRRRG